MSKDEFTKLFKYMEKRFDDVDKRLEQTVTKSEFNKLINTVDGYAKRVVDLAQEHLMLGHKVDRLEGWVHQIARKTGVKLKF
jgi:hypothetical protein